MVSIPSLGTKQSPVILTCQSTARDEDYRADITVLFIFMSVCIMCCIIFYYTSGGVM